jgi:autoinducer 2-degrading protein
MVTRIVKLTFKESHIEEFLEFFETIKHKVNEYPGCMGMQLMQQKDNKLVVFTYSQWEKEEDLNSYRDSGTFGNVWPNIKPWFDARPEAWTSEIVFNGFVNKKD